MKKNIYNYHLSIIVPAYNVENYIVDTIESIINQKTKYLYEVIIINDGSTDSTLDIIKDKYEGNNLITIYSKNNGGLSSARNFGVDVSRGEYIYFIDSDDLLVNGMVDFVLDQVYLKDLDLFMFSASSFTDAEYDGDWVPPEYIRDINQQISGQSLLKKLLREKKFIAQACLYVVKLSNIVENGLRFPEGLIYEDNYFTYYILALSSNVETTSEVYYLRRVRNGSIMTTVDFLKQFDNYYKIVTSLVEERDRYSSISKEIKYKYFFKLSNNVLDSYDYLKKSDKISRKYEYDGFNKKLYELSKTRYFVLILKRRIRIKLRKLKKYIFKK